MSMEQFFFIFADQELIPVYEEYLRQNLAWENFGFYMKVEEYRGASEQQLSALAEEIFEQFIEVDSAHELGDITHSLREDIRSSLASPSKETFNELCDIVIDSLANATITDFLKDPIYLSHVNKHLYSKKTNCLSTSKLLSCFF